MKVVLFTYYDGGIVEENTLHLVASNLTVAYYSVINADKSPYMGGPPLPDQIRERVFETYNGFVKKLVTSQPENTKEH